MNRILLWTCLLLWLPFAYGLSTGEVYMTRFAAYAHWRQHWPDHPEAHPALIDFIDSHTPLAHKLRTQWLYQLAKDRQWALFKKHYRQDDDVSVRCFYHLANYYEGNKALAFRGAKALWLTGRSQPGACTDLFEHWRHDESFNETYLSTRLALALSAQNLDLARYLFHQYHPAHVADERLLLGIHQHPSNIHNLKPIGINRWLFLYGIHRLATINPTLAGQYWLKESARYRFSEAEQQGFFTDITLQKAKQEAPDTLAWFARVHPHYDNDTVLEWLIRYALRRHQWMQIKRLTARIQDKQNLAWRYWHARALEATGETVAANQAYQLLARKSDYYGFLAAAKLHYRVYLPEEDRQLYSSARLRPYKPFLAYLSAHHHNNQWREVSALVNDFMLELPSADKKAFLHWIAEDLQAPSLALRLSNEPGLQHAWSLRFPMLYQHYVLIYATQYQLPPALIYAIIRQESAFQADVTSSAGARGLMQLMPSTASMVAKREHIAYNHPTQLFLFHKNMQLGIAYLKQLAASFRRHPALMAAAYNAGPGRVKTWRADSPKTAMDIWIETIPWTETRNYLKHVLAFYVIYQHQLHVRSDLAQHIQRFPTV